MKPYKSKSVFDVGEEVKGLVVLERHNMGYDGYEYKVEDTSTGYQYTLSAKQIHKGFCDTEHRIKTSYPDLMSLWD